MNYKEITLRTLAKLYLKLTLQITVQLYLQKAIHILLLIIYSLHVSIRVLPKVRIQDPSKINDLEHICSCNTCED